MRQLLAGDCVGVLGLARSGVAAAKLALAHGAEVYASDADDSDEVRAAAEEIRALGGHADVGKHDLDRLAGCDCVVLSPGIPPAAAVLKAPELSGIPIIPELEFGYELLHSPVIAVTGTNGKSTTTALLDRLLREGGYRSAAGGNIGTAVSEIALRDPPPDVVAVEASSFQLGRSHTFAPGIGVVTNLAPDHLDWYRDVAEYYADKAKLFQNATVHSRWVLNGEDEAVRALPGDARGSRYYFRVEMPLLDDERGGYVTPDGWLALRLDDGMEERLLPARDLGTMGRHNVANALAAALAARLFGARHDGVVRGLREFRGLPHRMEAVAERDGVLWINDSKATNIASSRVAIRSMDRPTVLMLGGRHKGEPYASLAADMDGRVRLVIAYGEAGPIVEKELKGVVPVERVDGGFEDAVRRAAGAARPGDAVLLSPACSSYDMFTDYEERGLRFRQLATEPSG